MDHLDKIRAEIFEEVKDVFEQETTPKVDLQQTIDLFLKVLIHPLDDPAVKLDGLVTRVPNALENILLKNLSRIDKNSFFPDVVKVEPFLRKILFIIDEQKYYALASKKEGLLVLIEELALNPNKINFNWDKILGEKKTFFPSTCLRSIN